MERGGEERHYEWKWIKPTIAGIGVTLAHLIMIRAHSKLKVNKTNDSCRLEN